MTDSAPTQTFGEYLTVSEAAEFLGVSPWTLRNWDKSGKLKPTRHPISDYRMYRREDLESLLRADGSVGKRRRNLSPSLDWNEIDEREHFVQFYESDRFLVDSVCHYVERALSSGEAAVIIATHDHRKRVERVLKRRGTDITAARASGQYLALDAEETLSKFMVGDSPDGAQFEESVGGVIAQMANNWPRVRAFGEMVALLWADGKREAACRLESLWNDLATRLKFTLFCAYPLDEFEDDEPGLSLSDVCGCHTKVIPAESYSRLSTPQEQLRSIALLQQKAQRLEAEVDQRKAAERELSDFVENALEGLHKVGPDGVILWANKAELDMLGYAESEYVGRHISEFHHDPQAIASMLEQLQKGENLYNQPAVLRCKDGSLKHVLIHSNASFERGRFLYSRCFTRDMTELRAADRDRAMLAAIVESSQDAIISKTFDGIIRSWNKGAERVFGHTQEAAVGKPITLIIPPDRLDEEAEILARLRRGERIEHYETVRMTKDGRRIDISLTISPLRDSEGTLIGASKVARDITERKRTEQALQASRESLARELAAVQELQAVSTSLIQEANTNVLYEKLLDAAIGIMRSDCASMQVVDENQPALRMLAYRGFAPDFGKVFEFNGPDTRTSCSVAWQTGKRVVVSDVEKCDFIVGTPALEAHRSTGIAAVQSTPLISRTGKLLGMISTYWRTAHEPDEMDLRLFDLLVRQAADLLERAQAEQRLRESEERFRRLVELLPVGVYTCEAPSGIVTFYNDQAAALWGRAPVQGDSNERFCGSFKLFHTDGTYLPHDQCPMATALRDGQAFRNLEVDIERPDGSRITALVNIDPIHDAKGQVVGAINVFHDITALKQAEKQLKEADRRKDEFLATLAHELRNPLAPIRNSLNILRMTEGAGAGAERLHEMMERQVAHMVRLVDDLLELSRISRGKIELQQQNVDISTVINHAVETSKPFIEAARHQLSVCLPSEPLTVSGDLVRLAQVFANLLNNSAKYTNPGGKITITGRRDGSDLIVSVRDTGVGIPREMLGRVFEMFAQVNNELSRTQEGLGIGLSLVRTLVTMHGGSVEARSMGLGHGSEFIVRLPLSATSGAESVAASSSSADEQKTSTRRILVVDDNRDSADSLGMLLKFLGADIHLAYDGASALDAMRIFRPSVVLLDLGMPGMDGFEVARRIRQMPRGDKLRMIALTGWGQAEDRRRSAEAGFDHHLVKPVDFSALQGVLASLGD